MGGILKNKQEGDVDAHLTDSTKEFREQVLKNTKLNAMLQNEHHNHDDDASNNNNKITNDERLQWNKQNLSENEVIQKNIIENLSQTIDEPKTPFQKATQPELNEYYQDDDDDEVKELEDFSLGEPEFKIDELDQLDSLDRSTIEKLPNQEYEGVNESGSDHKKSFEEMRKQHYHNEHFPVVHPVLRAESDADDEDEEEEEEEAKPKKSFAELRKQHYSHEAPKHGLKFDDEDEEEDDDQ